MMLEVDDLSICFPKPGNGTLVAVESMGFGLERGRVLSLIGESGSGKTLTGLAVMGLLPGTARMSGRIMLNGRQISGLKPSLMRQIRGREVAMVHQNPLSALNPVWPVGEQIAETIRAHGLGTRAEADRRATELLGRVGIPGPERVARMYPFEISGGMRQRVCIAMALSCGPGLVVADEPTTALDVTIKAQILDLLRDLVTEERISILLITHDMHVVAEVADEILVMYGGRIAEAGRAAAVLAAPTHPYTLGLLHSADMRAQPPLTDLKTLPGQAPPITDFPSGCRFHPRCSSADTHCRTTVPALSGDPTGPRFACHHPHLTGAHAE